MLVRRILVTCVGVCVLFAGCAKDTVVKSEISGSWSGFYRWDNGTSYDVSVEIDKNSIKGSKVLSFEGIEVASTCKRIKVKGTYNPTSRKVVLDEVSTKCASFVLDGVYEGILDQSGASMNLRWTQDDPDLGITGPGGALVLSKTG